MYGCHKASFFLLRPPRLLLLGVHAVLFHEAVRWIVLDSISLKNKLKNKGGIIYFSLPLPSVKNYKL